MTNNLDDFWPGIEAALPDDPAPLLVCADWCDEHDKPDLAFALRWCAGRGVRPYRRREIKRYPWLLLRDQSYYRNLSKSEVEAYRSAIIPACVFDRMPNRTQGDYRMDLKTAAGAYGYLRLGLDVIRKALSIPNIVVPPPNVVHAAHVICSQCGIVRASSVYACPVCASAETKGGGE